MCRAVRRDEKMPEENENDHVARNTQQQMKSLVPEIPGKPEEMGIDRPDQDPGQVASLDGFARLRVLCRREDETVDEPRSEEIRHHLREAIAAELGCPGSSEDRRPENDHDHRSENAGEDLKKKVRPVRHALQKNEAYHLPELDH